MDSFFCTLADIWICVTKIRKRIKMYLFSFSFRSHGKNFYFDPDDDFSYKTISVGDNVFIGPGARISATESTVKIGNNVVIGPNVSIRGGDHNFQEVGHFIYDVKEKKPGDDLPVIIEDDVWIGTDCIILKGVKIARGSIIGAGSVLTKNTLPYCIYIGIPAKPLKLRFNIEEIIAHENNLYSKEDRFPKEYLIEILSPIKNS